MGHRGDAALRPNGGLGAVVYRVSGRAGKLKIGKIIGRKSVVLHLIKAQSVRPELQTISYMEHYSI